MSYPIIPADINSLSFDSFGRDPKRDIVCLTPIRTIIRREEEITLVRKVRKVEEVDADLTCPATSVPLSANPFGNDYQTTSSASATEVQMRQPEPLIPQPIPQIRQPEPAILEAVSQVRQPEPERRQPILQTHQPVLEASHAVEDLIVHSQRNCFCIEPEAMARLQHEVAVSRTLSPGTYTIRLKSGSFDYRVESGRVGEPWVLLWFYGGKIVNHQTSVEVGATWASLNGYGDAVTLDVYETANLCAFFFDTYLEDNEGQVMITLEGPGYQENLLVHSQRNCYYIAPEAMRQLEQTAVAKTLQPGTYTIQLKDGAFGYRSGNGFQGEPLVLLWLYGGKVVNHKTEVEVNATWSSLNGYGDTLTIDVHETATLCAFFYDTYLEDNQGEVTLSLAKIA